MFRDSLPRLRGIWWIGLLAVCLGCGDRNRPTLVSVTGKVLVGGKPATAGSIIFHPAAGNSFQADRPSSLLQLDGSFTIKTYPYGNGVPPGKYKVTLAMELATRLKRPDLADVAKTPWSVEVPEKGLSDLVFEAK
jgi:hypothetical protein